MLSVLTIQGGFVFPVLLGWLRVLQSGECIYFNLLGVEKQQKCQIPLETFYQEHQT